MRRGNAMTRGGRHSLRRIWLLPLLGLLAVPCFAACTVSGTTLTTASASQSDVQDCFNAATSATTLITISGTPTTWSTNAGDTLTTAALNLTIAGASAIATTQGTGKLAGTPLTFTDTTKITDGRAAPSTGALITITLTGGSSQVVRMTGISIVGPGVGNPTYNGEISVSGVGSFRFDHNHMTNADNDPVQINCGTVGVADHNQFDSDQPVANAIRVYNGCTQGNTQWAQATQLGSANFFFMENDAFNGMFVNDCLYGGRYVVRYSILNGNGNNAIQTHATSQNGTDAYRGCRAFEIYGNDLIGAGVGVSTPIYFAASGTGIVWGNNVSGTWANEIEIENDRSEVTSNYHYYTPPNGWGTCGPGNTPQTGTVNVSSTGGTVTWVSGGTFSTSWLANTPLVIGSGGNYPISSVASTTSLTINTAGPQGNPGPLTGAAYSAASAWDGNAGNNGSQGSPCLDGFGRGQGDLISGTVFPSVVDSVTSMVSWPSESFEPVYFVAETLNGIPQGGVVDPGDNIQANRDYYVQVGSSANSSPTSPFNGSTGTGWGTLANRPTSCTAGIGGTYYTSPTGSDGVGYFATDANSGQGELYICTATNTWTASYEPYTYPHPLDTTGSTPPSGPGPALFVWTGSVTKAASYSQPVKIISVLTPTETLTSTGTATGMVSITACATTNTGSPCNSGPTAQPTVASYLQVEAVQSN